MNTHTSNNLVANDLVLNLDPDYRHLLGDLKSKIRTARTKAALAVNQELIMLYWHIGRQVVALREWGTKLVKALSKDLQVSFPETRGFSVRNIQYMHLFAQLYPNLAIVQQSVAQIPWGHNVRILDKLNTPDERMWYVHQTLENSWSRDVLLHHIDTDLYARQGKTITNFPNTLPAPQSDLAQQLVKDPYSFEFLTLPANSRETDLQRGLLRHLRQFLVELGVGFAYVGSNVHLQVGGDDFYLDLLFYHLRLRCFVVIDLKTGPFQPEHAGKMNFYLVAADEPLRHTDDQPSIGMILCREKNSLVVEYALRNMNKPIGVPEYTITESLPAELAGDLPTIEELEAELEQSTTEPEDQPQ